MPAKLTLSNLLVGGGGLLTFIFSFLKFYGGEFGFNAWDTDGTAFASTVPAILGLVAAVWVGLELANVKLPEAVLTFNSKQLKATWGIAALGIMISWFAAIDDKGAGFWLMVLGSLAMAAGAIMGLLGIGNEALAPSSAASTSTTSSMTPPPPPPAV